MNTTNLADALKNNIHITSKYTDIGYGDFVIPANVIGIRNYISGIVDVHIHARVDSGPANPSSENAAHVFSLPKIAAVFGASNISFNNFNTIVAIERYGDDINYISGYGYAGNRFTINPEKDNTTACFFCETNLSGTERRRWPENTRLYNPGNVYVIHIYGAILK